jgi:hypothetical protein
VDLLGEHREQDLPGAAELAEAGEDQPDHLLDPQVGIEAEAELAMPHIADRHADAQLTAPRFGAGGVEHAGTQHTELELADAALHAEQQPVVRPAGVIDPVQIDHARLHQPAELEQVMPVAAVAGDPGGIEAQHGPDLALTQPGDQPLEAGRATVPLAERPRSSSITSTSRKPRRRATSTSSYCRRWLSRLVWTCVCVDCRT